MILLLMFNCREAADETWMVNAALVLFIVAAASDAIDGYLARKQNQVTSFGRVLDPFADKFLVLGAFVLLLGEGFINEQGKNVTGLSAWMVVVILGRELLVTGLRGFSESQGKPYAANVWGKTKMIIQSCTVPVILASLGWLRGVQMIVHLRTVMIWLTVGVTVLSLIAYVFASRDVLAEQARE
jgi:CDP-diacylglycerol--glycerol-3-phosphate 3-phosphatidyltransferase